MPPHGERLPSNAASTPMECKTPCRSVSSCLAVKGRRERRAGVARALEGWWWQRVARGGAVGRVGRWQAGRRWQAVAGRWRVARHARAHRSRSPPVTSSQRTVRSRCSTNRRRPRPSFQLIRHCRFISHRRPHRVLMPGTHVATECSSTTVGGNVSRYALLRIGQPQRHTTQATGHQPKPGNGHSVRTSGHRSSFNVHPSEQRESTAW